jgi:hypothetical protein
MKAALFLAPLVSLVVSWQPLPAAPSDRYRAIDRHALRAPAAAEKSIADLADYLTEPARNDREKVRAIYRWITDRIAYNAEGYFAGKSGDNDAESVFNNRVGVCVGYANLFLALCQEAGVEAVKLVGRAKGIGFVRGSDDDKNHAWNAVKIGSRWHLLDATWGAGNIEGRKFVKQFKPHYFLTPPDQLIFSHFPQDRKWQLLSSPVSARQFEEMPRPPIQLFQWGVTGATLRELVGAADFRELVKTYSVPTAPPIQILNAPLQRHLQAGTQVRFRIESEAFAQMAVTNGKQWYYLKQSGSVFQGTITVPAGTLAVRGKLKGNGQKTFWALLEYVGE